MVITLDIVADAIKVVENSQRHPYGVMVRCHDPRKVCKDTIAYNYHCWRNEGCKGNFYDYLSKNYCPPNAKRWSKLVQQKILNEVVQQRHKRSAIRL